MKPHLKEWERGLELRFERLTAPLMALDPDALKAVEKHHRILAAVTRRRRMDLEWHARQRAKERDGFVPFATGLGELAEEIGATAAAAQYDVPRSTAEIAALVYRKEKRVLDRRKRDLEVMRLAGRGWTNERIARRLQVSPSQISRIVQRMLKDTRTKPPSDP